MPLTVADYSSIMKIDYKGPIRDLLNNTCAFLARMERYSEPMGGLYMHIPIRTQRTTSIGARNDGSSEMLPAGDKPTYGNATFDVKSLYVTVRVTGRAIRASRSENYAFAKANTRVIEDSVKDFKKDINRQLFGDSSAELCLVTGTSLSDVVYGNVTYSGSVLTIGSKIYPTNPGKFLHSGMKVDIRRGDTGAIAAGTIVGDSLTVVAVSSTTCSVFSSAGSYGTLTTTNAVMTREDNMVTGEIKEMSGLSAAVDLANPSTMYASDAASTFSRLSANFGGINRTTTPVWQGQVKGNSGVLRPFSVNLIESAIDDADINAGSEISLIQTNHAIFRIYGNLLAVSKTVDMNKMELDGGWKALNVNGIPMVKDVECPDYTIFCLDERTFKLGNIGDYEWIEDDGGGVLSRLTQQDQYEGVMIRELQLLCDNPRANVKIEDVSHS